MSIIYTDTKYYTIKDLQELFQAVGWLSANYPERLKKALDNSETVFAAWDGNKLAGLVNAIDDSELTAYVHYLCVNPEYQGQGIGRKMFMIAKDIAHEKGYSFLQVKTVQMGKYEDYDDTNRFYISLGFKEFEVFPTLWDEANLCQIYVMSVE